MGFCKFCDKYCELQKSHAIGRTVFRKFIKSTKEERFIIISTRNDEPYLSTDQWSSYQLCSSCERFFNENYENYSINALRGKQNNISVKESTLGVSYTNLDQETIALYFLSIFWRASESQHESYKGFKMPEPFIKILKSAFLKKKLSSKLFHVRVQILSDDVNILKKESLERIIVSPSTNSVNNNIIYEIIFERFYVRVYCKKPNHSYFKKNKYGFLNKKTNPVLFPFIDISKLENFKLTIQHTKNTSKSINSIISNIR